MPHRIQALIFDLDGVITPASSEFHYQAWRRVAAAYDLPFTRADHEARRGLPRSTYLRHMLAGRTISTETEAEMLARKQDLYDAYLQALSPSDRMPGLDTLLREAESVGVPCGVATASGSAEDVLRRLGLLGAFRVIAQAGVHARTKPTADIYLWVAGRLGAAVSESIVLEDSGDSLRAAREAGFYTVGVDTDAPAHHNVTDLSVITLHDLERHRAASP